MRGRALIVCVVMCGLLAAPAAAQPPIQVSPGEAPMQMLPPGRQAKTGTGRLRGRVVAADTGTIVRRAQVRISSPDIGTKTAFTDGQGAYEFRELPAGRFSLSVSKSGFVTMQYGQTRPFEPGRPIQIAEGESMDKADVALPRGSAISGRILDEYGEPVAEATVSAMRMQYANGRRRLVASGRNSTTNDFGQFRIYGLPPGEYYVSANLRSIEGMMADLLGGGGGGPVGSNNNTGYAATYFPGTPNPAEAQRIPLALAQESSGVDIQMQPVRLARITGIATGSDGKPMGGAMVMLLPSMREAMAMMPGGTSRTDGNGRFTISNVPPGEYSVQVQSMAAIMSAATEAMALMGGDGAAPKPAAPVEREFAVASISVSGDDVDGVVITGVRGAKARGTVVFAGGQKPDKLTTLRLMASPTDPNDMPATAASFGLSRVQEDGTFEIDALVGGRMFRFMDLPKGWYLKRILHENEDVTDTGYDFKAGQDVDGFTIELTTQRQSVNGTVTNDKGEALKEYTVVVFSDDREKWTLANSRWMSSARADQQGRFTIADLPAGAYLAVAVEYVPQGEWRDPDWLARAAAAATTFTLDEGQSATVTLKLSGS